MTWWQMALCMVLTPMFITRVAREVSYALGKAPPPERTESGDELDVLAFRFASAIMAMLWAAGLVMVWW